MIVNNVRRILHMSFKCCFQIVTNEYDTYAAYWSPHMYQTYRHQHVFLATFHGYCLISSKCVFSESELDILVRPAYAYRSWLTLDITKNTNLASTFIQYALLYAQITIMASQRRIRPLVSTSVQWKVRWTAILVSYVRKKKWLLFLIASVQQGHERSNKLFEMI